MLIVLNRRRLAFELVLFSLAIILLIFLIVSTPGYIHRVSVEHDFTQILTRIISTRNAAMLKQDGKADEPLYDVQSKTGIYGYQYETKRIGYLHKWADKQGVKFIDISSDIKITTAKVSGKEPSFKFINATEYKYQYHDSDIPSLFRIVTYHYIILTGQEDSWKIKNEWYLDKFSYCLNEEKIGSDFITNCISEGKAVDYSALSENRKNAVAYADRYCGASEYGVYYNKKYKNYNGIGGNCTNFISQVLFEGGKFKKNGTWNYEKDGSSAWVKASSFLSYMRNSGRAFTIAYGTYEQVLPKSNKLLPGDLVSYVKKGKVEHTAVVTGFDAKGYALINCHTIDSYRVPWDFGWNNKNVKFYLLHVNYK